jgi:hypothetical protein
VVSGKPSANPQGILLVVVLVIVIETSQVEHEDENDDEDDPQSRSAESIQTGLRPPHSLPKASPKSESSGAGALGALAFHRKERRTQRCNLAFRRV